MARLEALTEALAGVVTVAVERGGRVERSREQFGFAGDGVSEPVIDGLHARGASPANPVVAAGEFLLGHLNALGAYPISPPVEVAHDPKSLLDPFPEGALAGYRDFGRNGTFLVYRKLSQDVAGFWSFMEAGVLAHDPSLSGDETALRAGMRALAAKFMGRWPSGAPVALSPGADDEALSTRNDFLYLPDGEGLGGRVGAHTRRANPRYTLRRIDDSPEVSLRSVSQHRILRRGIRYGPALFDAAEIEGNSAPLGLHDDGEDRGLHFVALNADNQRQFEFVQQSWIDNPSFNGLYDNKDPVIGDNDTTGSMTIPGSPLRRRGRRSCDSSRCAPAATSSSRACRPCVTSRRSRRAVGEEAALVEDADDPVDRDVDEEPHHDPAERPVADAEIAQHGEHRVLGEALLAGAVQ